MLYPIAFSIHMLGLINLFGAMVVLQQVGARLRGAATWEDARTFLSLMMPALPMLGIASLLIILSGLYMAHARWSMHAPWVVVALVTVVIFSGAGPMTVGRTLKGFLAQASGKSGPLPDATRMELVSPRLWSTVFFLNFGALGIIWLMAAKTGWVGSIGVVLGMCAIGTLIGNAVARRTATRGTGTRSATSPAG